MHGARSPIGRHARVSLAYPESALRTLTEAEGRVIAVLLGARATSERERLRRLDVPRSTYHAARRRAYAEGWLRDRYVPDPTRFGFRAVSLALLRPFADRAAELAERWSQTPTNVLTWLSPQAALGVFFHRDPREAAGLERELSTGRWGSGLTVLPVDLHAPDLPVYFDYEGLWTHLAGLAGTLTYPNGLGGAPSPEGADGGLGRHARWAVTELVQRPFAVEAAGRGGHLVGPLGLPFSQLRQLREGVVGHRVFLDPSRVPPYQGRSADVVVFVVGNLRSHARPESLFATLTRECRVYPFLYASHEGRLLLGALGRGGGGAIGGAPTTVEPARRPVLPTLQQHLEGIEVTQEPAAQFRTLVDHRYDRILPRAP